MKLSYCVIVGKGNLISIGDTMISSQYEDDVCFVYGRYKVYLVRHIYRVFKETLESLSECIYNVITLHNCVRGIFSQKNKPGLPA